MVLCISCQTVQSQNRIFFLSELTGSRWHELPITQTHFDSPPPHLIFLFCLLIIWNLYYELSDFNANFNNISNISCVSFIGDGNQNTLKHSQTYCKSQTKFITLYCNKYTSPLTGIKLIILVVIARLAILC
jgi:hypothetical protein